MAAGPEETPKAFPQTSPQDLYPTSDIRFVLIEIGKLTTKVDRLIDDVKSQGDKIDTVRNQISFVRGALWVIGGIITVGGIAATIYLRSLSH